MRALSNSNNQCKMQNGFVSTANSKIAEDAKRAFNIEFERIETAVMNKLSGSKELHVALFELDHAKKAFIKKVDDAKTMDPALLNEKITEARSGFAKTFILLFLNYGLDKQLDELSAIELPRRILRAA